MTSVKTSMFEQEQKRSASTCLRSVIFQERIVQQRWAHHVWMRNPGQVISMIDDAQEEKDFYRLVSKLHI